MRRAAGIQLAPPTAVPCACAVRQAGKRCRKGAAEQALATEVARLKRQLAEKDQEVAILKKAAAYFAKNLS